MRSDSGTWNLTPSATLPIFCKVPDSPFQGRQWDKELHIAMGDSLSAMLQAPPGALADGVGISPPRRRLTLRAFPQATE